MIWRRVGDGVAADVSGSLPLGAPFSLIECGWPEGTSLAFAGWLTNAQLGSVDVTGLQDGSERVFAIVSRDRIELRPMVGPSIWARGYCALSTDGHLTETSVDDDWQPPR